MAPTFASLRSRKQEKPAGQLDHRYGDTGISSANGGQTWVEWTDSLSSPNAERPANSSPPVATKEEASTSSKASITITINLPWQKKSRRSVSVPPESREGARSPSSVSSVRGSRVSPDVPRSRVGSPVPDNQAGFSPRLQQNQQTKSKSDNIPRQTSSPMNFGTPALSILSPLTEGFDDPQTPASTTSETMTSIENSPSSPFKQAAFDDCMLGLYSCAAPKFAQHDQAVAVVVNSRPYYQVRMPNSGGRSPGSSDGTNAQSATQRSITQNNQTAEASIRRARSVEPGLYRRRTSDDGPRTRHGQPRHDQLEDSGSSEGEDCPNHISNDWPLPLTQPRRTASRASTHTSPRVTQGTYSAIKDDYSGIKRAIEADNRRPARPPSHPSPNILQQLPRAASQKVARTISKSTTSNKSSPVIPAARPVRSPPHSGDTGSQPSSAGSGYSSHASGTTVVTLNDGTVFDMLGGDERKTKMQVDVSGAAQGPQVLVPSGEDLWG